MESLYPDYLGAEARVMIEASIRRKRGEIWPEGGKLSIGTLKESESLVHSWGVKERQGTMENLMLSCHYFSLEDGPCPFVTGVPANISL